MYLPSPLTFIMDESKLTTLIIKALRRKGGFWFKIHGSAYQTSGIADIVGCYRGRFIALEVKIPGKERTLSKRQRLMLLRVRQHNGVSAVVTSTEAALEVILSVDRELD